MIKVVSIQNKTDVTQCRHRTWLKAEIHNFGVIKLDLT